MLDRKLSLDALSLILSTCIAIKNSATVHNSYQLRFYARRKEEGCPFNIFVNGHYNHIEKPI